MDFTKATIYTNAEGVDMVTGLLYDLGIVGVEITDSKDFEEFMKSNLRAWDIVDEELMNSMMSQETTVTFYLENNFECRKTLGKVEDELKLLSEQGDFGRLRLDKVPVRDEDWANNWKKYYKPLKIGKRIIIKPTWEEVTLGEGEVMVELDPGMAFGTGSHASTHMCLEFLEDVIKPGDKVLDIGTGSGILGIAALKLGADSVTAVDIDPMAVKIAKENALLNGYKAPQFDCLEGDLADKVSGKYDVVIANIVADIITELSDNVGQFMDNKATFITSGIINFKAEKVREALRKNKLNIINEKSEKDWFAFKCERN